MKQLPLVAAMGLSIVLAAFAYLGVAQHAPALSPEVLRPAPHGDWRVAESAALYHEARYAHLIAESHLATAPATAAAHFTQSLAARPGNAATWAALAEARLGAGDVPGAAAALETSRTLAPTSRELVAERLRLTRTLAEAGLPPEATPGLVQDLFTAERYTRRFYWGLMAEDAALAAIATAAGLAISR